MSSRSNDPEKPRDQMSRQEAAIEFAKQLDKALIQRGWSQSDLAKFADAKIKENNPKNRVGRDNISAYCRAKAIPSPPVLHAIAAALRVDPESLLSTRGLKQSPNAPEMSVRTMGDGNIWIRINRAVDQTAMLKIMSALNEYRDRNAKNR